ncbi:MAG: UDP-glucose 4-epimerase, partial [uncultured Thermomicrobiales bacterium]
ARSGDRFVRVARADARAAAGARRPRRRRPRPGSGADDGTRRLGRRPGFRRGRDRRPRHRRGRPRRRPPQARHRAALPRRVRRGQRRGDAQPAGGRGHPRGGAVRLHLDHLADDLPRDPGREGRRRPARRLGDGGAGAASAAQHLRRDEARRRAPLPAGPRDGRAARGRPPDLALLPGGGRRGVRDASGGGEHQGERAALPPPHGRGRRRGPCRRPGAGAGDRLRRVHRLGAAAVPARGLPGADRPGAGGCRAVFSAVSRGLRPARLVDVRLHRPRLRPRQGGAAARLRLPDGVRGAVGGSGRRGV